MIKRVPIVECFLQLHGELGWIAHAERSKAVEVREIRQSHLNTQNFLRNQSYQAAQSDGRLALRTASRFPPRRLRERLARGPADVTGEVSGSGKRQRPASHCDPGS